MCVPTVAIRDDGKGFMVQRAGVWFDLDYCGRFKGWRAETPGAERIECAYGETILEAVDSALAKVSNRVDKS